VTSSLGYLRSHDCNFRSPLMKTLNWSVETLGLGYNSTGLCNHLFKPEKRAKTWRKNRFESKSCNVQSMSLKQKVNHLCNNVVTWLDPCCFITYRRKWNFIQQYHQYLFTNILEQIDVCCDIEKCLENDFHFPCLGTEIFLRELTLSNTLSSNPKSSRSIDLQFSHKLQFYLH
jgi:hypothetical protein